MDITAYFLGRRASTPTSEQLAAFKEKEIDYEKIYVYNRKKMEDAEFQNYKGQKFFYTTTKALDWYDGNGVKKGKSLDFTFKIAIAKGSNTEDSIFYTTPNSPLKVVPREESLRIANLNTIVDMGICHEEEIVLFNEYLSKLFEDAEGVSFKMGYTQTVSMFSEYLIYLNCYVQISIENDEEGAMKFYNDFCEILNNFNNYFLIKIRNIPEIDIEECPINKI